MMKRRKIKIHLKKDRFLKRIISVLSLLLLMALGSIGVMAAYTHQSNVKGVAATSESQIMFMSDMLYQCKMKTEAPDYKTQKKIVVVSEETATISFYIRNYKGFAVNENQIKYTLKIEPSFDSDFTLTYNDGEPTEFDKEYSKEYTMDANMPTEHKFTITMPKQDLESYLNFKISATPTESYVANGYKLAAKVEPSVLGKTESGVNCVGSFVDESTGNLPSYFDAYNYVVTVSNAKGDVEVTLKWNPKYLEIDRFFISDVSKINSEGEMNVYKYTQKNGSKLIHFFKKPGINDIKDDWKTFNGLVQVGGVIDGE